MRKWKPMHFLSKQIQGIFWYLVLVQRGDGLGGIRLNESSNVQGGPTRCSTTS